MIDPADRLVHALKFHDRPEAGSTLGVFIARRLRLEGATDWDYLVPMPLHGTRFRGRGYNQSHEIARGVSRILRIPILAHALVRLRATKPQADLDYAQRRLNVRGAFQLKVRDVRGARLLLIDDVATTGHTLLAAWMALEDGGPSAAAAAVFALA
jgi:ComF family protein